MQNQTLINREKWVKDNTCKDCTQCGKPFILFVRGRHHCRLCGNVFCNDCSNYFIDISFFQTTKQEKKKERFCKECFEKARERIGDQGQIKKKHSETLLVPFKNNEKGVKQKSLSVFKRDIDEDKQKQMNIISIFTSKPIRPQKQNKSVINLNMTMPDQSFIEADYDVLYTGPDDANRTIMEIDQMEIENLRIQINEIKQTVNRMHDEMQLKLGDIIQQALQRAKIADSWYPKVLSFIVRALTDIKIENMHSQAMDINTFIKIKKFPYVNEQAATDYLWGIVCRKNVVHKRMKTYLVKPKIMVIENSLDIDNDNQHPTFESVLNNDEKKVLDMIVEKIIKVKPDIIFVEKSVNITIAEKLYAAGITIAQGFKSKILDNIKRTTRSRPLRRIPSDIDKYKNNGIDFLGKCEKLVFTSFDPQSIMNDRGVFESLSQENMQRYKTYLDNKKNKDPTMLFIKNTEPSNCITITMSSPNLKELDKLKPLIKQLLKLAHHLKLEKEMIYIDLRLQQRLQYRENFLFDAIDQEECMVTCGRITKFLYQRIYNEHELYSKEYICLTKIKFMEANIKNYNDIESANSLNAYKNSLDGTHKEFFDKNKINYFSECCSADVRREFKFYSKQDTTLGKYLIRRIETIDQVCPKCKLNGTHVNIYYGPNVYVMITADGEDIDKGKLQLRDVFQDPKKTMQNESEASSQIAESENIKQVQLRSEQMPMKAAGSRRIDVHVECDQCHQVLTEQLPLKLQLEFSFFRFVQHLMLTCIEQKQRFPDNTILINNVCSTNPRCSHLKVSRVFTHNNKKIKFYTNVFQTYHVKFLDYSDKQIAVDLEANRLETIQKRKKQIVDAIEAVKATLETQQKKTVILFGTVADTSSSQTNSQGQFYNPINKQQHEQRKRQLKKLLARKLEEYTQESLNKIQNTNFTDFLMLEQESMRCFTKFSELQLYIKRTKKKSEDWIFWIHNPLVKAVTPTPGNYSNNSKNEIQPAREGMLAFLMNTKVIQKEVYKNHKNEQKLKRRQMIESVAGYQTQAMKQSQAISRQRQTVRPENQHQASQIQDKNLVLASPLLTRLDTDGVHVLGISQDLHQNSLEDKQNPKQDNQNHDESQIVLDIAPSLPTFQHYQNEKQPLSQRDREPKDKEREQKEPLKDNQRDQKEKDISKEPQTPITQPSQIGSNPSQHHQHRRPDYKVEKLWPNVCENSDEPKLQAPTFFPFIPLYADNDLPAIAYSLNSNHYHTLYTKTGKNEQNLGFPSPEEIQFPGETDQLIENLLLGNLQNRPKYEQFISVKVSGESYQLRVQDQELNKLQLFNDPYAEKEKEKDEEGKEIDKSDKSQKDNKDQQEQKDSKEIKDTKEYKDLGIRQVKDSQVLKISSREKIETKEPAEVKEVRETKDFSPVQQQSTINTTMSIPKAAPDSNDSNSIEAAPDFKPAFESTKKNNDGTSISITEEKDKVEPSFKEQENELEDAPKVKQTFSVKVTIFYPLEFEALRVTNNISITQFIRSISSCNVWNSDGGKSGASFFKSADELFVFKRVKESEFWMFDEFAPYYFEYSHRQTFQKKPSVLNKIFGMFEVEQLNKNGSNYYIAMENLAYGIPQDNPDVLTYDLKGSQLNRWKPANSKTLLDVNFRIDRNSEPLPIKEEQHKQISQALFDDSDFLAKCKVVDYSLLLIINVKTFELRMGIIDWLQQYNYKKVIENRFKKMINFGIDPTIVPHDEYKMRFQKWMKHYFMGGNTSFYN